MSLNKKVITTYSKSLFQNVKSFENSSSKNNNLDITKANLTNQKFIPDVYIIGEELLLLSSTLRTSKKLNSFFNNPTYPEVQKLEILLNIFPGLTLTMKSFLENFAVPPHLGQPCPDNK